MKSHDGEICDLVFIDFGHHERDSSLAMFVPSYSAHHPLSHS